MLDLDDLTGHQVALIEIGDGAVDEVVHLLIGHIIQGEDGRVLNLTQRWTPFGNGAPVVMIAACRAERRFVAPDTDRRNCMLSGANRYRCTTLLSCRIKSIFIGAGIASLKAESPEISGK